MIRKIIFGLALLSVVMSLQAQVKKFPVPAIDYNPNKYFCFRAIELMEIDGRLDEHSWMIAPFSEYFQDIEGSSKPAPYFQTRFKMLWDDKYLYIAAELEEDHIWAKLRNRDAVIYYDNDFEVFIDPDGDTHNYFELEVNAFETIWDLLLIKPYRDAANVALNAYDMRGVKVGVHIDGTLNNHEDIDNGWTIEMAIPWSAVKELHSRPVPPKDGDQWRFNFSRVQWKTEIKNGKYVKQKNPETGRSLPEHNWVWSPQGLIAMHYPEMWGIVEFSYQTPKEEVPKIVVSETEKAKWFLRKMYYQQKEHFLNKGKYITDIEKIIFKEFKSAEFIGYPELSGSSDQYRISLMSTDGNRRVSIYQDGRVSVENKQDK